MKRLIFNDRKTVDVKWPESPDVTSLIVILSNPPETRIRVFCLETSVTETKIPEDMTSQNVIIIIYGLNRNNEVLLSSVLRDDDSENNTITLEKHVSDNSFTKIFSCSNSVIEQGVNGLVAFKIPTTTKKLISVKTSSKIGSIRSFTEYMVYLEDGLELNLPSREFVKYTIYETDLTASYEHVFTTHNTKQDVAKLLEMANDFSIKKPLYEGGKIAINFMYHDKPEKQLTGILKKYFKDENGDQASSINKKIKGVFFMASPDYRTSNPPNYSCYGKYRIKIPPVYLLSGMNLYFADFYCLKDTHYVTLVVTKPGSSEDSYCSPRLVELDIDDNNFLMYSDTRDQYITRKDSLWVEVLYTQDIDKDLMISEGKLQKEKMQDVRARKGSNSLYKKLSCPSCNLPKQPWAN